MGSVEVIEGSAMSLRRAGVAVVAVVAVVVVAGCSDGDDRSSGGVESSGDAVEIDDETPPTVGTSEVASSTTVDGSAVTTEPVSTVSPTTVVTSPPTTDTEGFTAAVLASIEPDFGNAVPYVLVGVGADDLPFVAYYDDGSRQLQFLRCDDPECGAYTLGGSYGPEIDGRWLDLWPALEWSPEGLPVVGLNVSAGADSYAVLLACSDPACVAYDESRPVGPDGLVFFDMDVAVDGTTRVFGGTTNYDPGVGDDGLEMVICAEPTCASGQTHADIDGWRHSAPHRVAVVRAVPVASRAQHGPGPFGEVVGVVQCLDPACAAIDTVEFEGASEHAVAAGADGPVALMRDRLVAGESEGAPPQVAGLSLHVWDDDLNTATEIELDSLIDFATIGFGADSVGVGTDGTPAAVWVRTTFNGDPDTAPPEAIAWAGWELEAVDTMPPELLQDFGVTADEGVFAYVPPNSAAAQAGLELGDVITMIGDTPVTSANDVYTIEEAATPGSMLSVSYERSGSPDTTEVTLTAAYDELLVARCSDRLCTTGTTAVLAASNPWGHAMWASLGFDTDNNPILAYRTSASTTTTTGDRTQLLRVARCSDRACLADARSISDW